MNQTKILARYDQLRKSIELYGMRRETTPDCIRHIDPDGAGMILYSDLTEANTGAVIRAQIAHFSHVEQPFEWVVYQHDEPADLIARLTAHGFEIDDPDAIMILDIAHAPSMLLQPVKEWR